MKRFPYLQSNYIIRHVQVIKTKDNPKDVANAYNRKMPFYFIIIKIYGIMDNMEDSHTLKQYQFHYWIFSK